MGCIQNCICCQCRTRDIIISLLFLLILSLTHGRLSAEGRVISKVDSTKIGSQVKLVLVRARMIGSRPPRCERIKCRFCKHCEAIQVPVVHPILIKNIMAYSRGDDISNYKPMCWKCKCGDQIFSP